MTPGSPMANQDSRTPARPHVLVVDDDEATRMALPGLLAYHCPNFVVETAANLEEALARIQRKPFQVIVLDARMPGQDGIAVMRRLREDGFRIPTVITTADVTEEVEDAVFAAGAYAFLRKPLDPKSFLKVLDYAIHYPETTF